MATDPDAPPRYGLVGHPVDHSRSPTIHRLFARQTGLEITYELIDAAPEQLETAVLGFKAAGGLGLNVTVPHKEAAFELSKVRGEEAKAAGAVNTLSLSSDQIRGDNTDGIGLVRDLCENQDADPAGLRILVLGAGGAARGIIDPILGRAPASLTVANRTLEKAEVLAERDNVFACTFEDLENQPAFDLVINATSAGLRGEDPPFPTSCIGSDTVAYDLVYSLKPTPFEQWSQAAGAARAIQGWGMLIEQAAESFKIWHGVRPNSAAILKTLLGARGVSRESS